MGVSREWAIMLYVYVVYYAQFTIHNSQLTTNHSLTIIPQGAGRILNRMFARNVKQRAAVMGMLAAGALVILLTLIARLSGGQPSAASSLASTSATSATFGTEAANAFPSNGLTIGVAINEASKLPAGTKDTDTVAPPVL